MYLPARYFFAARAIAVLAAGWSIFACPRVLAATNERPVGQRFVFRTWGTEAGLPQNTVNALVQTRDGYLWLGTQAGLARFDGVSFKVFGLAEGLPNVQVRSLFEDATGDLWIGTAGGRVSRLHAGKIEGVRGEGNSGDENVTALAADTVGHVWIGTSEGLLFWQGRELFRDESFGRVGHGLIRALLKDHDGVMWISSVDGLYSYKNDQLARENGPAPDTNFSPYCLLEDRFGKIWASIGNGKVLCRENGLWKTYDETFGLPFAYVTCLGEDAAGTVWAGSLDAGLYYFQAGRFNKLTTREGLSDDAIRSLLSDREGNLWVGHRTTGLDRLAARKLETWGAEQGLTNDYVRSVAETAPGQLWVGTTGGGLYYEQGGALRLFTNAPFNTFYPFVEAVLAARDGSLWWGGSASLFHWKDGRLAEAFTRSSNELVHASTVPEWLATAAVTALREDISSGLFVGTSQGKVVHLSESGARILTNRLARGSVTSFAQETDGTLWVGSLAGGLSRMRGDLVTTFSAVDGFPCSHVRVLHRTSDGVLWIGTGGGGLVRYQAGKFKSIGSREGLGDDTVSQILEDEQGCLWLGCNRGIFRIPRSQLDDLASGGRTFLHPQAFGLNAGMLAEECTGGSSPTACKLRSGKLAFATVRGVVLIDPQLQAFDTGPPTVLLEEVWADRKPQGVQPVTGSEKIQAPFMVTIPPGRRECEFHYTGLSFRAPERVRFRYRLSDLDEDWVEADTRRVAYYNPLRPGHYVFRVTACNDEGVWSDHEATLAVTVLPHLWETPWFRLLIGFATLGMLAGMAFWLARRRYKRRLAALETQQAIERERLRISQDMHDQIGGILTRVSILSDVGQSEHEGPAVRGQFERIGTQVRSAVRGLDEIVWATNPRNDNLPRFAEYVSRFADEFFEDSSVRCWQDMPTDLPKLALRADVRHNVFLAVKEALNNVLKHSSATEVWVRLRLADSSVCLELDDNGRGFPNPVAASRKSAALSVQRRSDETPLQGEPAKVAPGGNGLGNMKSRLAACGGIAEFASAPGQGVKIRFVFPLPRSH